MIEKELNFYINSVIENLDGGKAADTESERFSVLGKLRINEGTVALSYRENGEGCETLCEILINNGQVTVTRSGACRCKMVFRAGSVYKCLYEVPPFAFDMEIHTQRVSCSFTDDGGTLILIYRMKIGGQDKLTKFKLRV